MTITIAADPPALLADYVARLEHRLEIDRFYKPDSEGLKLIEVVTDDAERREMLDTDLDGIGARDTIISILDEQLEKLRGRVDGLDRLLREILSISEGGEVPEERLDRIRILAASSITVPPRNMEDQPE